MTQGFLILCGELRTKPEKKMWMQRLISIMGCLWNKGLEENHQRRGINTEQMLLIDGSKYRGLGLFLFLRLSVSLLFLVFLCLFCFLV